MPAMSAPSTPHARQLLSSRWVYRTLREVYLEDGHTVLKRFVHHPGRRDLRRVWVREDRALRRLAGLPVPHTVRLRRWAAARKVRKSCCARNSFPGTPLQVPTERDAADVGHLLGLIHERAVVDRRSGHGELRADAGGRVVRHRLRTGPHLHLARTPYFYFYAGKDMARVFRTAILGRSDLWPVFRGAYFAQFRPLAAARALTCRSTRFWLWHWRHRPIRPAAEARKS
jgi:hypothetical protein